MQGGRLTCMTGSQLTMDVAGRPPRRRELPPPDCHAVPDVFLAETLPLDLDVQSQGWQAARARRPAPSRAALQVYTFHRAFDLPRRLVPGLAQVDDALLRLRERLLDEETSEYMEASYRRDFAAMADALADIVYVAYGTAISFGLDLDLVIDEVHRANMSKLDEDGRPVLRHDGKVLKSPRYTPPRVSQVIATQPRLPFDT